MKHCVCLTWFVWLCRSPVSSSQCWTCCQPLLSTRDWWVVGRRRRRRRKREGDGEGGRTLEKVHPSQVISF